VWPVPVQPHPCGHPAAMCTSGSNMTASMTKTEENRLNKSVWASDVQPENRENTAIKTENPFSSPDMHDKTAQWA